MMPTGLADGVDPDLGGRHARRRRERVGVAIDGVVPSADGNTCSGVIPTFIAVRRMNPKITDTTTENTMPRGADVSASWVSSDMCADASYPVSVYCAFRSPIRATYSGIPRTRGPGPGSPRCRCC